MTLYIGQPNTDPLTGGLLTPLRVSYPESIDEESQNIIHILDHPDEQNIHHKYSISSNTYVTEFDFTKISPIDLLVVVRDYYLQRKTQIESLPEVSEETINDLNQKLSNIDNFIDIIYNL